MSEKIVYVIDDDEGVRKSLALLLNSMGVTAVCFSSALEFLNERHASMEGCLLVDVRMPEMSGLELQRVLNERDVTLPIIFITGHGDVSLAVRAMRAGAFDFIEKPFRDQELLERINQAFVANETRNAEVRAKAVISKRLELLTPREHEIMDRIVSGQANKLIALELGLSERTVEIHRAKVMAKMQASSLAELVVMVTRSDSSRSPLK